MEVPEAPDSQYTAEGYQLSLEFLMVPVEGTKRTGHAGKDPSPGMGWGGNGGEIMP